VLNCVFYPAQQKDCRWLWQLRQHPTVAGQSLSPESIPYIKHYRWYRKLLSSQTRHLYIFTNIESMDRLGFVRSEEYGDGLMLSWAIDPNLQGQGVGKVMLETWCLHSQKDLWAQIKTNNEASKTIAARMGFYQKSLQDDVGLWLRPHTHLA
jgi:RimJ/RimL family protein N-acetyltransferase